MTISEFAKQHALKPKEVLDRMKEAGHEASINGKTELSTEGEAALKTLLGISDPPAETKDSAPESGEDPKADPPTDKGPSDEPEAVSDPPAEPAPDKKPSPHALRVVLNRDATLGNGLIPAGTLLGWVEPAEGFSLQEVVSAVRNPHLIRGGA